jgi:hypothetical protein
MKKFAMAAAIVLAMSAAAWAQNYDAAYGFGDARVTAVNAPGGDYIQCDPRNPSSPVRCKADGW